ncbi:MAG: cupin domain-containing protein [candidate division KSB1 bacterium]|nr:cupin domain-containing protein [candidate division KSB1 bacterium]MDZ7333622.1 cupin domain-containing protein [candidate division KSB1 bacterium]MDZ7357808.1 cupin domain-containing protein [candidate division KSB1 bacterium]MDZ7398736.1 cupin domain-containing protein [candidate division KSB1 bacterium]
MKEIKVEHNPGTDRLNSLGVASWPIWTKEVSQFPWEYDESETCYFLDGEVIVTPENGTPVKIGKGDLVIFPKGMRCTWKILKDVRKHYRFE